MFPNSGRAITFGFLVNCVSNRQHCFANHCSRLLPQHRFTASVRTEYQLPRLNEINHFPRRSFLKILRAEISPKSGPALDGGRYTATLSTWRTFSQCCFLELALDIAHCFIEANEKNDLWGPKDGLLKFTSHLLKDSRQMLIYLWNGLYFTSSDVILKTSSCRNENGIIRVSIKLRIYARTEAKCWGIFSPSAWVTASASQCWRQHSEECLA